MHKQKGATFISWVAGLGVVIFAFITIVKLAPLYIEFYAVHSFMDKIAMDSSLRNASTQHIRGKVSDYLDINGIYGLKPENFSVVQVEGKENVHALAVSYEVRKHWIANIDFLTTFEYSKELGKAGDT